MATKNTNPDYANLKNKLDQIVEDIENPDINIDQAIELYEEGMQLIQSIEKYLGETENKIKKITAKYQLPDK